MLNERMKTSQTRSKTCIYNNNKKQKKRRGGGGAGGGGGKGGSTYNFTHLSECFVLSEV